MKKSLSSVFMILLLHLFSIAQTMEITDSLRTKITTAAREIMSSANTCALITLDEKDIPRVRTMDPFPPEQDLTVWFGTNPKSRKVAQIQHDPRVTLYYIANGDSGYVTIHGKAQLINDQETKDKYWKEEWKQFYADQEENYLLIKVTPEWMEVVSYMHGIVGDPETWQPPAIYFRSK